MGHGTRFDEARARLLEVADELPAEHREVLACGAAVRAVLAPGEELLLLEARLEGVAPEAAPASLMSAIEELAETRARATSVLVFGDAPLEAERLALLPDGFVVERVEVGDPDGPREENRGITALGVSPASSGAWDTVDVLVELAGDELAARGEVAIRLDGEAAALTAEELRSEERGRVFVFRDVPARGQRFLVSLLGEDTLALDDSAEILLPDRPLLRVGLSPSLPEPVRSVLDADPAVVVVPAGSEPAGGADVYLARSDEPVPDGVPVLRFVPATSQVESFLVTYPGEREADDVILEVVGELGLAEIDSTGLAEAAARPIVLGVCSGAARQIAVWEELLGSGFDFVDSRSFPLFMARSLRWLVGAEQLRPWSVAGEPVAERLVFLDSRGTRLDPVGAPFTPPAAGDYTGETGVFVAALLSPEATGSRALPGNADPTADVSGGAFDPVTWLLLLAGALLVLEWYLVRTGRMP